MDRVVYDSALRYRKIMTKARVALTKYKDLLKISTEDTDLENDLYLSELVCSEEFDAIMELVDSLLEKEILRCEIAIRNMESKDEETTDIQG